MRSLPIITSGIIALILIGTLEGCCDPDRPDCPTNDGIGGGEDVVTIDMPFADSESISCSQGVAGGYSHRYSSTFYDVDFDTPNDESMPLYAPVGGVAYVHDQNDEDGFGIHLNLDLGDGTYIVLGHLSEVFIDNGSEVAAGQMLGYEGTTGASTGDHVHLGRHDGDATRDATQGESIEGLAMRLDDNTTGENSLTLTTGEMTCALPGGHVYASHLDTPKWHPNGSLVKTPSEATVYLLDGGEARAFRDEESFWSRGYDFADVALVDKDELACYGNGSGLESSAEVSAVYDDGTVWLVTEQDSELTASQVRTSGWQAVLKSWGIEAATYDDLLAGDVSTSAAIEGYAAFRDGSLVREVSSSAVYVMSDGIAMPIETWEAYLLLGFEDRAVIEVDDGTVRSVMDRVGDCTTNAYCVSRDDVLACGGPSDDEATYNDDPATSDDVAANNEGEGDDEGDHGGDSESYETMALSYSTPNLATAERITLSGEWTVNGVSEGWQELQEVHSASSLLYSRPGLAPGDSLRFSVEYERQGSVSWSCLAPFPPGTVQGDVAAVWGDTSISVVPTDDPSSSGCGLTAAVPN